VIVQFNTEECDAVPEGPKWRSLLGIMSSVEQHDTLVAHLPVEPICRRPRLGTPDVIDTDINTFQTAEK